MNSPTNLPRESALRCQHLDVFYGQGAKRHHAVRDVSFEVFKGETFGLVGGSGCGKSTILRMLAGLDGDWRGDVTVLGQVEPGHAAQGQGGETQARCQGGQPVYEVGSVHTHPGHSPSKWTRWRWITKPL